jgi:NitT/TauT family transport system substrate-binding protein
VKPSPKLLAVIIAAAAAIPASRAAALETVTIGVVGAVSDVTVYIAEKQGFFKEEGLTGNLINFDSGAKMVAPLGAGQLDVGTGAWSAGLFNAVERGIGIKIVADKATNKAPNDYRVVIVRNALIADGTIKTFKDFKGRKVGVTAQGAGDNSSVNEAMKSVGLKITDVERVYMGFGPQLVALSNGGIDAAFGAEPDATIAERKGIAKKFAPYSSFYPVQETGVILFGSNFIEKHRDTAQKFMLAYLRAVRFYDGALQGAHLTGPNADVVIQDIAALTKNPDTSIFREMSAHWANPDGKIDLASLKKDMAFYKESGDVTGAVKPEQTYDLSFAEAALKELGPYKAASK